MFTLLRLLSSFTNSTLKRYRNFCKFKQFIGLIPYLLYFIKSFSNHTEYSLMHAYAPFGSQYLR